MIINATVLPPEILKQLAEQNEELSRRLLHDRKLRKKLKSRDIKHVLPEEQNDQAATKQRRETTTTRRNEK